MAESLVMEQYMAAARQRREHDAVGSRLVSEAPAAWGAPVGECPQCPGALYRHTREDGSGFVFCGYGNCRYVGSFPAPKAEATR